VGSPAPPNFLRSNGIAIPITPAIALEAVVVNAVILPRSSVLLVIAAGRLQNGMSTDVNAILPVMRYSTAA